MDYRRYVTFGKESFISKLNSISSKSFEEDPRCSRKAKPGNYIFNLEDENHRAGMEQCLESKYAAAGITALLVGQ